MTAQSKNREISVFRILTIILFLLVMSAAVVSAETTPPKYHGIPAYQFKDIYSTNTVEVPRIEVRREGDYSSTKVALDEDVEFIIYNVTLQREEMRVTTEDGYLPAMTLTENFNYIIKLNNRKYRMNNLYIWVHDGQMLEIKNYTIPKSQTDPKISDYEVLGYYDSVWGEGSKYQYLTIYKRIEETDPESEDQRVTFERKDEYVPTVYGSSNEALSDVYFKLVSDVETLEAKTDENGHLILLSDVSGLLEEVTYMVMIDHEKMAALGRDDYEVELFPIVVKDKSEYDGGRYFYNHANCHGVNGFNDVEYYIRILDKGDAHQNDTTVTSMSGDTTVSGFNFSDFLIYDRTVDTSIHSLSGDYEVIEIDTVNPHRWEKSKLAAGDFDVTRNVRKGYIVDAVYTYNPSTGDMTSVEYTQNGNTIDFTMHTMALEQVVIHYEEHTHAYEESVTPATPDEDGTVQRICACGEIEADSSETIARPSTFKLSTTAYTYDGKVKAPSITVKNSDGNTLTKGTDYTVTTPSGRKNVGSYTYKITFQGKYSGTKNLSFKINPPKTSLKKVSKAKKAFTAKWTKKTSQVTGYEIQYATNSKFTKAKIARVTSYKTISKKVSKLSAKKKYYVRIRTYKTVNGKKYYSAWSSAKSVKTK